MEKLSGDQLLQALRDAQERHFVNALDTVRATKAAEPGNIYLVAIEKQVARLADLSVANLLSEDEGIDIMESLPELVNRALQGGAGRPDHPTYNGLSTRSGLPSTENHPAKANILSALKSQYFNRADDLIKKGDYQGALLEVRRIYVLDPSDHTARAYEQNIEQLTALQREGDDKEELFLESEHRTAETDDPGAPVIQPESVRQEEISTTLFSDSLLRDIETPPTPKPKSHRPSATVIVFLTVWALIGIGWLYMLLARGNPPETPSAPIIQQSTPAPRDTKVPVPPSRDNPDKKNQQSLQSPQPHAAPGKPVSDKPQSGPAALTVNDPAGSENGKPTTDAVPGEPEKVTPGSASDAALQSTERKAREFSLKPLLPSTVTQAANGGGRSQAGAAVHQLEISEKEPQILRLEHPQLSDIALKNGMEGEVTVQVQIDPQGNPLQARILKSTNDFFDQAVMDAVMQSKYSPGMMSTGPVTTWITIPFKFRK
jgi:TonB family protein